MSRAPPTEDLIRKAEVEMVKYYNIASSWEDAMYIGNEEGKEEVLPNIQEAFDSVHKELQQRYMGCGPISTDLLKGLDVVDLGSGYARNTYAYGKLVGETGTSIGVELTEKESNFARQYEDWHREVYGYKTSNVTLYDGSMTDLGKCNITDKSKDLIISDGAVCMVPDVHRVYEEVQRTLKDGGEFQYYSVFADQRVDYNIFTDSDMAGHGLGCDTWNDQVEGQKKVGMSTPRIVNYVKAWTKGEKPNNWVAGVRYMYVTYRSFKLPSDVVQQSCDVTYNGRILHCQDQLRFDSFTTFKTDVPMSVDGELAAILRTSRYAPYFSFSPSDADTVLKSKNPKIDPFTLVSWD